MGQYKEIIDEIYGMTLNSDSVTVIGSAMLTLSVLDRVLYKHDNQAGIYCSEKLAKLKKRMVADNEL